MLFCIIFSYIFYILKVHAKYRVYKIRQFITFKQQPANEYEYNNNKKRRQNLNSK